MSDNSMTIGKVKLDLTYYPGEDLYSDGVIEDELLNAVSNNENSNYRKVIEETVKWPFFYHLSPVRCNIVNWLPIGKTDKVLEVGSGCGAISGALCKMAGSVTGIDLSLKRSRINANRNRECDNLNIMVGNFKDIETALPNDYDYVCLIGVFEYAKGYMGTDTPYEDFLNILLRHVKPGGRLVIAIENKMGLKYFAGCREDHTGGFFDGIEDYTVETGVRTFSKAGLTKIFNSCGVNEYHFYYPYPDYKFPNSIFSDEWKPKTGELYQNLRNFDRERLVLFDETKAFDMLIREGMFEEFSNSYMAIIGPDVSVKYARFSNDRADEYCIKTLIEKDGYNYRVYKCADNEEANSHIEKLYNNYEALTEKYAASPLEFNKLTLDKDAALWKVRCEYIDGVTLEELLDKAIFNDNKEEFSRLFNDYISWIDAASNEGANDYDLIFSNIIIDSEQKPVVIDYEWLNDTYDSNRIIARALSCYFRADATRKRIKEWVDISRWEALFEEVNSDEVTFQQDVLKDRLGLYQIRYILGNQAHSLDEIMDRVHSGYLPIRIYRDFGEGISEENAYNAEFESRENDCVIFKVSIDGNVKKLRIDPGDNPCAVSFESICIDGEARTDEFFTVKSTGIHYHNGRKLRERSFLFKKSDPHITFNLSGINDGKAHVYTFELIIDPINENIAKNM